MIMAYNNNRRGEPLFTSRYTTWDKKDDHNAASSSSSLFASAGARSSTNYGGITINPNVGDSLPPLWTRSSLAAASSSSNSSSDWLRARQLDDDHGIGGSGGGGGNNNAWPTASWSSATGYQQYQPRQQQQKQRSNWWWQLNANTSRTLVIMLGLFLALLAVLYEFTLHKNTAKMIGRVFVGALFDTGYFIYNHMIMPALVILIVVGVVIGAIWYKQYKWHKAAEEQRLIFDMVEKILALLKKHYEECLVKNNRQPYLAVPHVRDMLIAPSQRKQLMPIWEKAVQYLNENESRVRTENQIISGEEFMVWRWLQVSSGTTPIIDEKLWQGHAFPEEQAALNMPVAPYFECLKLRGLFDPELEEEDDWPEHIQDAILEKVGTSVRVMHVAIDTESMEGCVYMKLGSKEEAGEAYKILHGLWFNGRLVTVKYLRPERYHERFPESERCLFPLRVKKPRHSMHS